VKTLYLDGRRGMRVALDGPALRVVTTGRADGRYPLGRVTRVVTIGNIAWQPRALLACFHFGVSVAMLDRRGRFVRLCFAAENEANGLARHLGELLEVERYRRRFERWRHAAQHRARGEVLAAFGISKRCDAGAAWQAVLHAQARIAHRRVGRYYALLKGLTQAQLASSFARLGLPADPLLWRRSEYRLLETFAALESWQHVRVVDRLLGNDEDDDRRQLIVAFEHEAAMREERFARWRQELLLALLGIALPHWPDVVDHDDRSDSAARRVPAWLQGACEFAGRSLSGNAGWLPNAPRDSLRSAAKILRVWLQYDRPHYEFF
jgi:hypothetical protein